MVAGHMKAIMLTDIRAMEMREVADPEIRAPDDVLIKMGTNISKEM